MMTRYQALSKLTELPAPSVIMMAGVPASGKSTIANQLGELLDVPVLSSDGVRAELTGSEADLSRDREVWSALYDRARQRIEDGDTLIVDATHNNQKMRERDAAFYRNAGARMVVCVYVMAELDEILRRNRARERFVPEDVIRRMHNNLRQSPPCVDDGFDSIITLHN